MRGWDGTENRGRSSEKKLKKPRISNSRSHDRVVYDVYLQTQSAQPLRTPYTKVMGQHSRKCQNHMEKRWGILTASTSAATAAASPFRLLTIDRKDISCLRRASARMLLRRVQPRIVRSCEWYLLMTIVKVVLETKRNENESPPFEKKKKNIREKLLKWLAVHSQGLCIGAGLQSVYIRAACSLGRAEPANSSFILPPLLFFLLVHFGTSRRMYVCFLFPCLVAFLGFLLLNRKKKK